MSVRKRECKGRGRRMCMSGSCKLGGERDMNLIGVYGIDLPSVMHCLMCTFIDGSISFSKMIQRVRCLNLFLCGCYS